MNGPKDMKDLCEATDLEALIKAIRQNSKAVATETEEAEVAQVLPQLPNIYYCIGTKEYFLEATGGVWIPVNENSIKRHLKGQGFRHGKEDSGKATPLEKCL